MKFNNLVLFLSSVFLLYSGNNSAEQPKTDSTFVAKNRVKSQSDQTGFFYFELTPTSNLPFYFSDVKQITYSDNVDLGTKQDAYMKELRDEAVKDGQDQNNYNQKSSTEESTSKAAADDRTTNIRDLKNSGTTVIEKTLN